MITLGVVSSSQKKSAIGKTITGFSAINDGGGDGSYPNGTGGANYSATGGSGTGAIFKINWAGRLYSSTTLINGGTNYKIGDILTVSDIYGGTTTITVTAGV
jgi:hypothetical protein